MSRRMVMGGSTAVAQLGAARTRAEAGRRILIRGGHVLTQDPALGELPTGDVLIDGARIERVAAAIPPPAGSVVIEAAGMVVLPGLVDNHRHLWSALLRGASVDHTFQEYFSRILFGVQPRLTPEDLYLAGLLAAYEALDAGVTTVLDWNHGCPTREHAEQAVAGLRESGIRAVFAWSSPAADSGAAAAPAPEEVRALHAQLAGEDRLGLAVATRNPDTATDDAQRRRVIDDITLARELGVPVTLHTGFPGTDSPAWLAARGLLGPDVTLVHGNAFTPAHAALIAEAGASVSSSPEVELQMGLGVPPLRLLLEHGAAPTVSVDILTAVTGDLFTQLRFALQAQRMRDHADGVSPMLTAEGLLAYVTSHAAGSLLMGDRIGSLTPGKLADVMLLDATAPNLHPAPARNAPLHAHPGNVHTVLVGGRVVKRHGVLVDVDPAPVRERAAAARHRLLTG